MHEAVTGPFMVSTTVVPIGLVIAAGPLMSAIARGAGRAPVVGTESVGGAPWIAVAAGTWLTFLAIGMAWPHRMPLERGQYAPWPLTVAGATLVDAPLGATVSPSASPAVGVIAVVIGVVAGGSLARVTAVRVLGGEPLPVSTAPARSGVDRLELSGHRTAMWAGRMTPLPRATSLLAIPTIGIHALLVAAGGPRWIAVVGVPLTISSQIVSRSNRRLRVLVGPTGVEIRSGVLDRVRRTVALDVITAAGTTTVRRRAFKDWYSAPDRLAIVTRSGPALRMSLTVGSVVDLSVPDPAEPARLINGLLDRRAVSTAGR